MWTDLERLHGNSVMYVLPSAFYFFLKSIAIAYSVLTTWKPLQTSVRLCANNPGDYF